MKILNWITLSLTLLVSVNASAISDNVCREKFGDDQLEVLKDAYFAGVDRGHGYTLAAIAWQESSAGRNLVNEAGPAYGVFQNLSSSVCRRLNQNGIQTSRAKVAKRLVNDFGFSAEMAMEELEYWKGRHNGNWDKTIASYYAGGNWKHSGGQTYMHKIRKKVNYLRQHGCMFNEL